MIKNILNYITKTFVEHKTYITITFMMMVIAFLFGLFTKNSDMMLNVLKVVNQFLEILVNVPN